MWHAAGTTGTTDTTDTIPVFGFGLKNHHMCCRSTETRNGMSKRVRERLQRIYHAGRDSECQAMDVHATLSEHE